MKVLMQNRTDGLTALAGDTIQVAKTRDYLLRLGLDVRLSAAPEEDLTAFDLVHLFNILPVQDTYKQFDKARRLGKKVLLSPIYWDPGEYLRVTGQNMMFGSWWERTMPLRREIIEQVAVLLPNSQLEREALQQMFGRLPPTVIVPNAADQLFVTATPDRFYRKYGWRDFLLSVGRICRRKNQLSLIRAARQLGLPLVLIGPLNDGGYYQECRRAADRHKVLFIDTLSQAELASAYAAARVHALVSWYDTPGLVSLEAALAGCRIVSTDRGSTSEYLGESAVYCDPGDAASIRRALAIAWERRGPDVELRTRIINNYNWRQAARATLRGYQMALGLAAPAPEVRNGR
ncbi:MAG: glycosyltransferase family 4 protein [Bacillota bacterium]|jgi:glycosyltransferase involved in cell wall biosynthesis